MGKFSDDFVRDLNLRSECRGLADIARELEALKAAVFSHVNIGQDETREMALTVMRYMIDREYLPLETVVARVESDVLRLQDRVIDYWLQLHVLFRRLTELEFGDYSADRALSLLTSMALQSARAAGEHVGGGC